MAVFNSALSPTNQASSDMAPKRNNADPENGKKQPAKTTNMPPTTSTTPQSGSATPAPAAPKPSVWGKIPQLTNNAPKATTSGQSAGPPLPDVGSLAIDNSRSSQTPASGSQSAGRSELSSSNSGKKADGAKEADKTKKDPFDVGPPEQYATAAEPGKQGLSLKVRANMFQMVLDPKLTDFFVYRVELPQIQAGHDITNRKVMKEFIERTLQQAPFVANRALIATDWREYIISLVNLGLATGVQHPVQVLWRNQTQPAAQTWTVNVELAQVLSAQDIRDYCQRVGPNINVSPHLLCLNILTRKRALERIQHTSIKVGSKKLFDPAVLTNGNWNNWGLVVRAGYFNSVLACNGNPAMNIHAVSGVFIQYPQPLLQYAGRNIGPFQPANPYFHPNGTPPRMDIDFRNLLKGLNVRCLYDHPTAPNFVRSVIHNAPHPTGRSKRVNDFGPAANRQTFLLNNVPITVADYFNNHVLTPQTPLQWPHPSLHQHWPNSAR